MLSWVAVVGTIAISLVSAFSFLLLRCRGTGYPFGPSARWWAITIVVITAAISTGLGLAAVAAGGHGLAAYVGLILPSSLWLGKASTQRLHQRDGLLFEPLAAWLTLPLRRLDERMGDDMQEWCDTRLRAASRLPQWLSDAARYYYNQVGGRLRDDRAREELSRWRESIVHKIRVVRLIGLETTPVRLQAVLQSHPSTRDVRKYAADNPRRLARRLIAEAENELHLFLAYLYRLGYHRLLIYPFRSPPAQQPKRGAGQSAEPGPAVN